jgi:uncharacterized protein YciI
MPYFALIYDTVDNFVERRQPYRGAHLDIVDRAHRAGALLMAGALKPSGALLVFRTEQIADVEQFATQDPYVVNGLVSSWRVFEWTVVTPPADVR